MKRALKIMSVFLALVMLTTALTAGFVGMAEDVDTKVSALISAIKDDNDYVRTLTNYTSSSVSDSWNDDANYISYAGTVTAKDNSERSIALAAKALYAIVGSDQVSSNSYGKGNYTLAMVGDYIIGKLEERMSDESRKIRVDNNGNRYVAVDKVVTNTRDVYVDYNATSRLNARCIDADGSFGVSYDTLDWWSSDTSLCMVDEDGRIYTRNPHDLGREVAVDPNTKYEETVVTVTATSVDNPLASTMIRVHLRHKANVVDGVDKNLNAPLTNIPESLVVHQAENTYDENGKVTVRGYAPELYATEFEYYNVKAVIRYMLGGCSSVTSANWFHTYKFEVATDFETTFSDIANGTIISEFPNGYEVPMYYESYSWPSHIRTYDESGTQARYSLANGLYDHTYREETDTETVAKLYEVYQFFCTPYGNAPIDVDYSTWTNLQCEQYASVNHVDEKVEVLKNYSNEFLSALFGKSLYTIMATVNMVRPNFTYTEEWADGSSDLTHFGTNQHSGAKESSLVNEKYYLYRNVRTNKDGSVSNYWVSTEDLDNIIHHIDSILQNGDVGDILKLFLSTDSSLFTGSGLEGSSYANGEELLMRIIQAKLYSDDIVNLVVEKLYPVLGDVYETATDVVSSGVADIGEALRDLGLYFRSPSDTTNMWIAEYKSEFADAYNWFTQNNDWHRDSDGKIDGFTRDTDELHWKVNGNKTRFIDAMCCALSTFSWILYGICDPNTSHNIDGSVTALYVINLHLKVYGSNLYGGLLVPLFEALGIGADCGLLSPSAFMTACGQDNHEADDGPYWCHALRYLLIPLTNWIENKVVKKPIETICGLLPSLSHFLQSGNLKNAALNCRVRVTVAGIDASFVSKLWKGLKDYVGEFDGDYFNIWGVLTSDGLGKDIKIGDVALYKMLDPSETINIATENGSHTIAGGCVNAILQGALAKTFSAKKVIGMDQYGYVYEQDYSKPLLDEAGNQIVYEERVFNTETEQYEIQAVPQYEAKKYAVPLPTLCDKKLQEAGVMKTYSSQNGLTSSRIECNHPGLVLLFLLRYVFYGINYTVATTDWSNPSLLNAFLDDAQLYGELFLGISINDLISNIVLAPEEAVCALVELFISNEGYEFGSDVHDTAWENYYSLTYPDYKNEFVAGKENFGAPVRYSQYWTRDYAEEVVSDITPLIDNVLAMLKLDSLSFDIMGKTYSLNRGINAFLADVVTGIVYQNDILSTLADALYGLLYGLSSDDLPLDVILEKALGISFGTDSFLDAIHFKTVSERCSRENITELASYRSEVEIALQEYQDSDDPDKNISDVFYKTVESEGEDGETVTEKVARDWGLENTTLFVGRNSILKWNVDDLFIANLVAILAPAAELLRILLLGKDLSVFNIINLDMYEIYYYTLIPLFETLGCANIVPYEDMARNSKDTTPIRTLVMNNDINDDHYGEEFYVDATAYDHIDRDKYVIVEESKVSRGNLHLLEDFVSPVKGLIDVVIEDPVSWIFSTIPNLMYFLLIGAFNDAVNNLLHFAYVLLDILRPILDGYDVLANLLATLDLSEYGINLSIPLDLDINGVVNALIGGYLSGNVISVELLGAPLAITLPDVDLTMLCTGKPTEVLSVSGKNIIKLADGGKGDLITVILEYALEILFMGKNWENISAWLAESQAMDEIDTETTFTLLSDLNVLMNEKEAPDKVLYIIYVLISKLTSVTGKLAERFKKVEFGLLDLFNFDDGLEGFINRIKQLISDPDNPSSTATAAGGLLERLKAFFMKIKAFFKGLFRVFKTA